MSIPHFVSRAAWGALPPKLVSLNFKPWLGGVAIHHTGGTREARRNHADCAAHVRAIQQGHLNKKYDDIAYTYLVCKHGYVFEGRGVARRTGANGTVDANDRFYAVCGLVGGSYGFYDEITPEMIYGFRNSIAHLRSLGNAGAAIVRHGQLYSTDCPGRLSEFFSHMEPGNPGKGWVPSPPKPEVPPFPGVVLHYPPMTVHSSARTWQQQMARRGWSIGVDGAYGEQSRRVCLAFQQEKGLTVDGVVGAQTWYAAWTAPVSSGNSNPGAAPDWPGVLFGYPPATTHASVRTWQQQMAARGWSIGADGVYGQQSRTVCLAFQREKGLNPDGIVGPATWHAAWASPLT